MRLVTLDSSETGAVEHPQGAPSSTWARPALVGVALAAVVIALVTSALRSRSDATVVLNVVEAPDAALIRVYVGGEVESPGIYSLDRGSRVAEAIEAAGGPTRRGDTSPLQMGGVVEDGDQVIVPEVRPTPRLAQPSAAAGGGESDTTDNDATAPVNINRATPAELEALPEIGPKLAERIIEYRETNGPFTAIEQLAEIRGISDRMVEVLRPLVVVGP